MLCRILYSGGTNACHKSHTALDVKIPTCSSQVLIAGIQLGIWKTVYIAKRNTITENNKNMIEFRDWTAAALRTWRSSCFWTSSTYFCVLRSWYSAIVFFLMLASINFDCDGPNAQAVPKLKWSIFLWKDQHFKIHVAFLKQGRGLEVAKWQHDAKTKQFVFPKRWFAFANIVAERWCFRTNGLAVFLAQPKNRRFAGLGYVHAHVHKGQRPDRLLRWFV